MNHGRFERSLGCDNQFTFVDGIRDTLGLLGIFRVPPTIVRGLRDDGRLHDFRRCSYFS